MSTGTNETPQIPEVDRLTSEGIDSLTVHLKGRDRWRLAARLAEDRAYRLGWEAREAVAAKEAVESDLMVKCPACHGTGKMWGYGDQCKRCFGATVVKASTLEPEKTAEEEHGPVRLGG